EMADCVAIGGAMANDFIEAEGLHVGKSLVDTETLGIAAQIMEQVKQVEQQRPFSFLIPVDSVVSTTVDGSAATRVVDIASHSLADIQAYPKVPQLSAYTVANEEKILDLGPISAAYIAGAIR